MLGKVSEITVVIIEQFVGPRCCPLEDLQKDVEHAVEKTGAVGKG